MIADIVLAFVVIALLAVLVHEKRENKKERAKFINALIAKTPTEFRELEIAEKTVPEPPQPPEPEFVPESEISDEKFKQMIAQQIG